MKIDLGKDSLQWPRQPPDPISEQKHQRRQQDNPDHGGIE
jgi:hypothetical protein